jgi:hypothetical protein
MDTKAVPDSFEDQFVKNCFLGGRLYILKEPLATIPRAKIQMRMWAITLIFIKFHLN